MAVAQAKIREETVPHEEQHPFHVHETLSTRSASGPSSSTTTSTSSSLLGPKNADEYDPARPNDYEEYNNERQARVEQERQRREQERQQQREQEQQQWEEEDDYPHRHHQHHHRYSPPPQASRHTAASEASASPKLDLNVSGEEAWRRRAAMSAQVPQPAAPAGMMGPSTAVHDPYGYDTPEEVPSRPGRVSNQIPPPPSFDTPYSTPSKPSGGLSIAEQMMKKMGWQEGRGLGKEGQGMVNPLEHKKLKNKGPASGVIVDTNAIHGGLSIRRRPVEFSKVILLRNMVGPGEVDADLEEETAEECTKYGPVVRCTIYEEKNPMVPPDKAVRIFVQFATLEAAIKV